MNFYNFSISNDHNQIINFPLRFPSYVSLTFSYFCLLTLVFDLQWHSLNYFIVIVSVSFDFPSNSEWNTSFHHHALIILLFIGVVFVIIEEMYHGRASLIWMLLLLLSNFWVDLLMNWHISQVELHSAWWFSATFATIIALNIPFLYGKSFLSKAKFRQASNRRESVPKATKRVMLLKKRVYQPPQTWFSEHFSNCY